MLRNYAHTMLGYFFFALAAGTMLASLFYGSYSNGSSGTFLALILVGFGKWVLGKAEGKSARETFGRAIKVEETLESATVGKDSRSQA